MIRNYLVSISTAALLALALGSLGACAEADQAIETASTDAAQPSAASVQASAADASQTAATSAPAASQEAEADRPVEPEVLDLLVLSPLELKSVSETNDDSKVQSLQVHNLVDGRVVTGSNFDAVGTGDGCTSSMVSANVLVTAAHCIDGRGEPAIARDISFSPRASTTTRLKFTCTMHPEYKKAPYGGQKPRSSHDIALCLIQNPNDVPLGMKFEVVDLGQVPVKGKSILMMGYGCTGVGVEKYFSEPYQRDRYMGYVKGSSDGLMRVGNAEITETKDHPYFQSLPRTQAIVESHAEVGGAGAKLCPGDSGGPVFEGITETNHQGPRRIIGVNSSVGGIAADAPPVTIVSRLVDFNDVTIRSFFRDFTTANSNAQICGYNVRPGTGSCRQ